jgi:ABC-type bacteriocin/lantibiotic exporter with double-glycine peptidase domain
MGLPGNIAPEGGLGDIAALAQSVLDISLSNVEDRSHGEIVARIKHALQVRAIRHF